MATKHELGNRWEACHAVEEVLAQKKENPESRTLCLFAVVGRRLTPYQRLIVHRAAEAVEKDTTDKSDAQKILEAVELHASKDCTQKEIDDFEDRGQKHCRQYDRVENSIIQTTPGNPASVKAVMKQAAAVVEALEAFEEATHSPLFYTLDLSGRKVYGP